MTHQSTIKPVGKFKRSWLLLKSSWRVFKLDKELTAFPLISSVLSIVILAGTIIALLVTKSLTSSGSLDQFEASFHPGAIPLVLLSVLTLSFVSYFFSAAVIHAALSRFEGKDPTIRGSLAAARRRWKPILFFSTMMGIVGLIIGIIQDSAAKIPYAGGFIAGLLANLAGFAWEVANFFSLVHIMHDKKELQPLQATRKSIQTIKKVWGEGVVSNVGLGIIAFVSIFAVALSGAGIAALAYNSGSLTATWSVGAAAAAVLIVLSLVFSVLSAILKAAIFYYAETGKAPEAFDRELLKASMTTKKASKIFGGNHKDKTWA